MEGDKDMVCVYICICIHVCLHPRCFYTGVHTGESQLSN